MTPMEAIQAATSRAAEMLDMKGEIGVIAPGAFADIVAVTGDPLKDVKVLEKVVFVMKDGKVFKEATSRGRAAKTSRGITATWTTRAGGWGLGARSSAPERGAHHSSALPGCIGHHESTNAQAAHENGGAPHPRAWGSSPTQLIPEPPPDAGRSAWAARACQTFPRRLRAASTTTRGVGGLLQSRTPRRRGPIRFRISCGRRCSNSRWSRSPTDSR